MRRALGEITEPEPATLQRIDRSLRNLLERRDEAVRRHRPDLYATYMCRIDALLDQRLAVSK